MYLRSLFKESNIVTAKGAAYIGKLSKLRELDLRTGAVTKMRIISERTGHGGSPLFPI